MTDFEKSINRNMTQDKFETIRRHVYGDGGNTFSYNYGAVSSWFTWHRDKSGKIAKADPPDHRFVGGQWKSVYDGSIENWNDWFASKLTTDIIFLGLNMSGEGKMDLDLKGERIPYFQNARGHGKIVDTFFDTMAEGGYFTDIIKPDKRINEEILRINEKRLKQNKTPFSFSDGAVVKRIISKRPDILKDHIQIFKDELLFIGADKPLLIVFEDLKNENKGDISWILKQEGLGKKFIDERFHAIVKIMHYSSYPPGSFYEGWKNDTREKLKKYINIP